MAKPISPAEAAAEKLKNMPDAVIDTWNRIIAEKFDGHSATIKQNDIVVALAAATGVNRHKVFDTNWLYIEDLYRKEGWTVTYDKPDYNENYEAYFEFKKK